MNHSGAEGTAGRCESPDAFAPQAIERLFQEHLTPLTRFVYSYVKSWTTAEDIVQDVFLQLWLRQNNLEPVRDITAYLYTIARYDALDYLRHQSVEARHKESATPETVLLPNAEQIVLTSEVTAALHRAVNTLPRRQREILMLRLERQATYQEIATKLRLSRKTVDAHLRRAFARLREILPTSLRS